MKRSGAKSAKSIPRGYRTHTISSAIKADYGKQDVREKLSELNSTVESRVEDVTSKPVINEKVSKRRTKGPFVVGKVKILSNSGCQVKFVFSIGSNKTYWPFSRITQNFKRWSHICKKK